MAVTNGATQNAPILTVLNSEQIARIHTATLEILERTGICVTHPRALEVLAQAGARISGDRVRLPACLVNDAIQEAPSGFWMGGRQHGNRILVDESSVHFGAGLDACNYMDPLTGERRPFLRADCRTMAGIANSLSNCTWNMTLGFANDAPPPIADRTAAKEALTYSDKPLVCCCGDHRSLRAIYDMAVACVGGRERFRRTPCLATLCSAISPLRYDDDTVEKIIFCAQTGIPVVSYSGLQAGATAPATFAGTIVQGSAESLGGLVMAQLFQKGAPVIYGALTTIMDMATTVFSYGAPEMNLMHAAMVQMARHYHLPFFGTAGCSDAKFPEDPQAVAEATFSCLSAGLSGANLIHDLGLLDHSELVSPTYLVLVDEIISMLKPYLNGVQINEETLAVDVIDRVGPGRHYLGEAHTRQHFRKVWYSRLFDRSHQEVWLAQGGRRFDERLHDRLVDLMSVRAASLPPDVAGELDRMAADWAVN